MICEMYCNIHDVIIRARERRGSGDGPLRACDGEHHYRFYPDGRETVDAEMVDGKPYLTICPQYTKPEYGRALAVPPVVRIREQTFDTFEGDAEAVAAVREFPQDGKCFTLILAGRVGRGKTHLAKALQAEAIAARRTCEFVTAHDLAELFLATAFRSDREEWADAMADRDRLTSAAILIIDDLPEERVTNRDLFRDQFKSLLDKFEGHLVVTTNKAVIPTDRYDAMPEIQRKGTFNELMGEKITSRLLEQSRIVRLKGRDHRMEVSA